MHIFYVYMRVCNCMLCVNINRGMCFIQAHNQIPKVTPCCSSQALSSLPVPDTLGIQKNQKGSEKHPNNM